MGELLTTFSNYRNLSRLSCRFHVILPGAKFVQSSTQGFLNAHIPFFSPDSTTPRYQCTLSNYNNDYIISDCRMTGPGVEYGGEANTTKSGDACLRWTAVNGTAGSSIVAVESKFPDGSRSAAGNRCRNPTGDSGGPWCYVSVDGATVPDYCETSDCDGPGCSEWTLIGAAGDATEQWSAAAAAAHGHYTSIVAQDEGDPGTGDGGGEASFELKAWDPASGRGRPRPFRISLTAYPIGYRGPSGDGFEVPVPAEVFVRSPDRPVRVHLSWRNGLVVLTRAAGRPREVLSFELNGTLTPVTYVSFAAGDRSAPVAVRFPECDQTATGRFR